MKFNKLEFEAFMGGNKPVPFRSEKEIWDMLDRVVDSVENIRVLLDQVEDWEQPDQKHIGRGNATSAIASAVNSLELYRTHVRFQLGEAGVLEKLT